MESLYTPKEPRYTEASTSKQRIVNRMLIRMLLRILSFLPYVDRREGNDGCYSWFVLNYGHFPKKRPRCHLPNLLHLA